MNLIIKSGHERSLLLAMPFDPTEPQLSQEEVSERVYEIVETAGIGIFVKGTKQLPQCGYSKTALRLVFHYCDDDVVTVVNVLDNLDAYRTELEQHSGWTTIPQVFVKGVFVGGCDILEELNERGELGETLNADDKIEPLDMGGGETQPADVTDGPF